MSKSTRRTAPHPASPEVARGDASLSHRGASRRRLLKGGLAATGMGAFGIWAGVPSFSAAAASPLEPGGDPTEEATSPIPTSANGWPIAEAIGSGYILERFVPGTTFSVPLRFGAAANLLVHVVSRFNYEIDLLEPGHVTGFRPLGPFAASHETNFSSGTAVAIRREWYPIGTSGGFTAGELTVIRDIVAECEGVIRWGGDFDLGVDECHFQIDVPPDDQRLERVAAKLRKFAAALDEGPGTGAEQPFTKERKRRAKEFAPID